MTVDHSMAPHQQTQPHSHSESQRLAIPSLRTIVMEAPTLPSGAKCKLRGRWWVVVVAFVADLP
ncbi:hypothetical protein E2C01_098480 [Portunus trituberculatus]|uniref:Uncharacterized protein n=1 Tax=Portunus trituberculatus TaxID=210409 RepID=A0A5B7K334_PORTR|nr:hypothetical protein [Portunus trituberculatus]